MEVPVDGDVGVFTTMVVTFRRVEGESTPEAFRVWARSSESPVPHRVRFLLRVEIFLDLRERLSMLIN